MICSVEDKRAFVDALSMAGAVSAGSAMSAMTTLGIGGPAELLFVPRDAASLATALKAARDCGVPVTVVGGGSNILVRDSGIEGLVVTAGFATDIAIEQEDDSSAVVTVGSGVTLGRLINFLVERGLSGLEGLGGVPGLVGGAIAGNAGSFGMEMKDVLMGVTLVGPDGTIAEVEAADLKMGYRTAALPEGVVIAEARMRLKKDDPHEVRARLVRWLAEKKSRQPLSARSAGCVFKNPVGDSAGMLIDKAGCKGLVRGGIAVSEVHANFFVNLGGATASDFLGLAEDVALRVRLVFGVELDLEIKVVGR